METKKEKKIKQNNKTVNFDTLNNQNNIKKMKEINESFNNYKSIVFKIIFSYMIIYAVWLLFSMLIGNKIEIWYNNGSSNNVVAIFISLLIAIFIGFLYCADGYISALIKTPFSKVTFEINNSNLNKKEKEDLLFKITVSNESIRETIKKFGMLTLTGEIIAVFLKGKPMLEFIKNRYSSKLTNSDTIIFSLFLISLLAYLIPLFISMIYIWDIEKKMKSTYKFNYKKLDKKLV